MPKLKTNKAILSRLKITSSGKMIRRPVNQSHFNTKDSGKTGRLKHRVQNVSRPDTKSFKQYLPYHN